MNLPTYLYRGKVTVNGDIYSDSGWVNCGCGNEGRISGVLITKDRLHDKGIRRNGSANNDMERLVAKVKLVKAFPIVLYEEETRTMRKGKRRNIVHVVREDMMQNGE